ncbi:acyltransferase family protein [Microbacterium enclense]|uniref:acyltransferase family protein n=1 Tax=Microbacterium enclense TaxID=993073 RepID=UPI003F7FDE2B
MLTRHDARAIGAPRRRADLDGLRALAIVLVVVYHVWLGRVSGGVDVFILMSAYFLTASFLRRSDDVGFGALPSFWLRRFAQLLPAAALTITAVLAFASMALPSPQWRAVWDQSWASLTYWQNVALADASVDYYARDEVFPSPLQHFWSLSIQGQVFLLWPIIIVGGVLIARRFGWSARTVLTVVFAALFTASFAYSVHLTAVSQQEAYFDTAARLWEFAFGSLAALVVPRLRIGRLLSIVLGWGGLIALVTCGMMLDVGAGFPGVAALWPTVAAVAIIVAGHAPHRSRASVLLVSRPLTSLGGISYALYLVHWPILVAAMVVVDSTRLGVLEGAAVIALSLAAAWALTRSVAVVADPIGASRRRDLRLIVVSLVIVALPLAAWQTASAVRAATLDPTANPGAEVLMPWFASRVQEGAALVPLGTELEDEWIALDGPCDDTHRPAQDAAAESCVQSIVDESAPTFVAVGDSHAQQWLGAILPVLQNKGWNVVALLKGGCSLGLDEDGDDDCREWRHGAADYVTASPASVAMFIGTKAIAESDEERVPAGLDRVVSAVAASGTEVLLVRDNPRFGEDMFACVEQRGEECGRDVSAVLATENPAIPLAADPRVSVLDLSQYLCPAGRCPAVIGNVAVYMDDNHLSGTYARSLSPAVQAALAQIPGIPIG